MIDRNAEFRADMSQYYCLKSALEEVLGRSSYAKLKESGTLQRWETETRRLLRAIELAISATVQIADDDWHDEITQTIEYGHSQISGCNSAAELFAALSATLTRLVFIQIGFLPTGLVDRRPLTAGNWKLDPIRTVQYVQNPRQRKTAEGLRRKRDGARAS